MMARVRSREHILDSTTQRCTGDDGIRFMKMNIGLEKRQPRRSAYPVRVAVMTCVEAAAGSARVKRALVKSKEKGAHACVCVCVCDVYRK